LGGRWTQREEKEKEYERVRRGLGRVRVREGGERERKRMKKREGFKILYSCRAVCDGSHHLPSQFSRF